MHISFVIQDLYRQGAQYVTALLANGLAKKGHTIDVVVSGVHTLLKHQRRDLVPFALDKTVNLIELPHSRASMNVMPLRRFFIKKRPDIVMPMSSTYEPSCVIARRFILHKNRPKIVPVEHSGGIGMKSSESKVVSQPGVLRKLFGLLKFPPGDHIIAVSKGVASALRADSKYSPESISVIPNPVIDDLFWEKHKQPSMHPWLKEKKLPVIIAAGSHVPLKGYDILIKAFALVIQRIPCQLIIFGEGPETGSYIQLAKSLHMESNVSFPGHTNALPAELKNADLFVVSSHCESFSIVLVEALASGVPVVATKCPTGPSEILHEGLYGILVAVNDVEALADGIYTALTGNAIAPVPESWDSYSLKKIVEQYEEVLYKVLCQ